MQKENTVTGSTSKTILGLATQLLALADLQARLLELVKAYMKRENVRRTSELSHKVGAGWTELNRLLSGESGIRNPKFLPNLAQLVGAPELAHQIPAAAQGIPDRFMVFASLPEASLKLVISVHHVYDLLALPERSYEWFASCFAPFSRAVYAACLGKREHLDKFNDPAIAAAIGRKLEELQQIKGLKGESKEPSDAATLTALPTPADPLNFAGGTSPLGPTYVLTGDSYREHEMQLGADFIIFARTAMQNARAALNIASTHKNDGVRKAIREKFTPEVAELELAIRHFDNEFPSELSSLFDGQRNTWSRSGLAPKDKPRR